MALDTILVSPVPQVRCAFAAAVGEGVLRSAVTYGGIRGRLVIALESHPDWCPRASLRKRTEPPASPKTADIDTQRERDPKEMSKPVSLTVVIPCRNEVRTITSVLADLASQDFSLPFEVIVADGISEDGTRGVLDDVLSGMPFRLSLRVVDNKRKSTPCGLNLAVKHAAGAFIVRVDAHSRLSGDFLRSIYEALESGVGDVVGPQVRYVAASESPTSKTIAAMLNSRFGNGGTSSRNPIQVPTKVTHTVMSCYRRKVWEAIGGYEESLLSNEDYEFDYRANLAGFSVVSLPRPVYNPIARATLIDFAKQRWRYGTWKSRVLKMHPTSIKLRQIMPMLIWPVAFVLPLVSYSLTLLLAMGYSAVAAYSVVSDEKFRGAALGLKVKCALLAPAVAVVTHFVWGAGAWAGLVIGLRART